MQKIFKKMLPLSVLIIAAFLCCFFSASALSEDETSGTCGSKAKWSVDVSTGNLTISGSGDMASYSYNEEQGKSTAPWSEFASAVNSVSVEEGITKLGNNAFAELSNIKSLSLPKSLKTIGTDAFRGTTSLKSISLASGNKNFTVYNSALFDSGKTKIILFPAQSDVTSFILPSTTKTVSEHAFQNAANLSVLTIPGSVTKIGTGAFESALGIKEMTFEGVYPDISNNAFQNDSMAVYITGAFLTASRTIEALNGANYQFGGHLTYAQADTLYVSFDTKGTEAIESVYVFKHTRVSKPADPQTSAEGVAFFGWYKESSLKTPWDFELDMVNENMTLYAKWATRCTVSFDSKGGNTFDDIVIAKGDKIPVPDDPTNSRNDIRFAGWYRDSACTVLWNFNKDTVSDDMTLFAKWSSLSDGETYLITNGANLVWYRGSEEGAEISSSAPFDKFLRLEIDSKRVNEEYFDVYDENGTVIVLHPDFAEKLKTGNHTFNIISADGSVITLLNVQDPLPEEKEPDPIVEPEKKKPNGLAIFFLIVVIICFAIGVYLFLVKKGIIKVAGKPKRKKKAVIKRRPDGNFIRRK